MKTSLLHEAMITSICLLVSSCCNSNPPGVSTAFRQQADADTVVEYWTTCHFSISRPPLTEGQALNVFSDRTFTPLFPSLQLKKRSVVVVLSKRADPMCWQVAEVMTEAQCYFCTLGFSTVIFQRAVSDDNTNGLPIFERRQPE